MIKVSLKGVKKIYPGNVTAVHDFNLDIEDQEFIVLVGPSGCGKSTTLRMVAGLEEISEGELYIDGVMVNDVAPKDRDIVMVFQNYALYPHMTVYENMAFSLKLKKTKKDVIDRKVKEAAELLGITELLQRKPKALSGGQRQRVAIGRAIVREPQVFLMDEPLSNLDAKLRNQMRAELIKLRKRINTTFIYVTHDQTEAMTLGDRIVVMKDGFIQQTDTPAEVYNHPRNLFVAGFIGMPQMNFLNGRLEKKDDRWTVKLLASGEGGGGGEASAAAREGLQEIVLPAPLQEALKRRENYSGGPVVLGIRPEHISVSAKPGDGFCEAEMTVSEMMGNEIHMHMDFCGSEIVARVQTIELPEEFRGGDMLGAAGLGGSDGGAGEQGGRRIYFRIPNELVHVFDPETGESLLY